MGSISLPAQKPQPAVLPLHRSPTLSLCALQDAYLDSSLFHMVHLEMIQMCPDIRAVQPLWVRGQEWGGAGALLPSLEAGWQADPALHNYPYSGSLPLAAQLMRCFPSNGSNNH